MIHIAWFGNIVDSFFFVEEEKQEYICAWDHTPTSTFEKLDTYKSFEWWEATVKHVGKNECTNITFLISYRNHMWESEDKFYEEFPELLL